MNLVNDRENLMPAKCCRKLLTILHPGGSVRFTDPVSGCEATISLSSYAPPTCTVSVFTYECKDVNDPCPPGTVQEHSSGSWMPWLEYGAECDQYVTFTWLTQACATGIQTHKTCDTYWCTVLMRCPC